ncbi:unnamed protein product [Peronospora belbahrii]|uniref:Clathrin/coatomer adaptor adaptin-like N-terminal domain-containing protein n=1 Tax=Peronospora belbahrii TaxID=622444 RepID=A0AAU9KYA8_9STRA|nr:unnamed protein product [Peronospora belbahrii]
MQHVSRQRRRYEAFKAEQPQALVISLVQLLHSASDPEARAFAPAVLKVQLLEALVTEPIAHVRRKLGHLIAELAVVSGTFDLLAKLAEYVSDLLVPHKESFLTLFTNSLNDANGEVQIASLKAASAFLLTLEDKQELLAFAIIIAEVHPKFFRNSLGDVARAMISVCSSQELDSETRELALGFVIELCENAGGMVRKSQFIVTNSGAFSYSADVRG